MKSRKGMFYSLSAALLLVILALAFYYSTEKNMQKREISFQEVRLSLYNEYTGDFEDYYLEALLSISTKEAFLEISNYVTSFGPLASVGNTLENLVNTGTSGGISMNANFTAPVLSDIFKSALAVNLGTNRLNVTVDSVTQPDPWHIKVNYTADFEFSEEDAVWYDIVSKEVTVTVYGFKDPLTGQTINQAYWYENATVSCFLMNLGASCSVPGIVPVI